MCGTNPPATLYVLVVSKFALCAVLYVSQSIIAMPGCCFLELPDVLYTFEFLVVSFRVQIYGFVFLSRLFIWSVVCCCLIVFLFFIFSSFIGSYLHVGVCTLCLNKIINFFSIIVFVLRHPQLINITVVIVILVTTCTCICKRLFLVICLVFASATFVEIEQNTNCNKYCDNNGHSYNHVYMYICMTHVLSVASKYVIVADSLQ